MHTHMHMHMHMHMHVHTQADAMDERLEERKRTGQSW